MINTVNSLQILRVHVAPVGFEVDRIVLPAIKMKADRVWLIIHSEPNVDKGGRFVKLIQAKLKDARIDCLQAQADRIDLFDILRALRTIVLREKGNSILVNVSVGSKIQAIASMMACMMFKDIAMIKPYYVVPERYNSSLVKEDEEKQETEGVKDIIGLPEYKIEIPTDKLIRCLDIINKKTDGKITKRELKDLAIEHNLIYIDDNKKTIGGKKRVREYSDQAAYMTLNKNLIEPLLDWRFITESKIGSHHVVSLTDDGKHALKFLNANI
ncbi:MAG TPA: DUF6293 family protein [Nitrososphaeraceae archaeon]|nr:DUF6293 family protein [Nitrososphaeraceae archaeon]